MYKYPMQLTQPMDNVRYVNHMEFFTVLDFGKSVLFRRRRDNNLEKISVFMVIESLRGEFYLRMET